jgi:hypothetical protein
MDPLPSLTLGLRMTAERWPYSLTSVSFPAAAKRRGRESIVLSLIVDPLPGLTAARDHTISSGPHVLRPSMC